MELVHTEERFMKLISKPSVESFQRFSEDLVAVKMLQPKLALKRPIYAGMVILDLAKLLMYDFYYNVLKKKYGDRVDLLFTDTDSLCISVNTQDVYKAMAQMQDEFDCSDYPEYHFLHNKKNKKVLGKFKDEMCGNITCEFVGLRSKMYSIVWCEAPKNLCVESSDDEGLDGDLNEGSIRTCKGISKSVNKLVLKHNMYKNCLMDVELRNDRVQGIGSNAHQLYTYDTSKVSICPFDDKRYVLDDKINTLACGHYNIKN